MRQHDSSHEASEADLADQAIPVVAEEDDEPIPADNLAALGEVDPADAMDQRRAVPLDEER